MILINTKSILACEEQEEETHNKEITAFFDKITQLENVRCGAVIQRTDKMDAKPVIKECSLHDCIELIEYVDAKNGVDLYEEDGCITFFVYGQGYCRNGAYHYVVHKIKVVPFEKDGEPLNVFRKLDEGEGN